MKSEVKIIEFVGPPGSGKTTVKKKLFKSNFSNSNTTVKRFYLLLYFFEVLYKAPKLYLFSLFLLFRHVYHNPLELLKRLSILTLDIKRLDCSRKSDEINIFCEAFIKNLKKIDSYSKNGLSKYDFNKALKLYSKYFETLFIFFKVDYKNSFERVKKRNLKRDKKRLKCSPSEYKKMMLKSNNLHNFLVNILQKNGKKVFWVNANKPVDEVIKDIKKIIIKFWI